MIFAQAAESTESTIVLQGWINIAIQSALALATIAVAILAIWGDRLKAWMFKPGAQIELQNVAGELVKINIGSASLVTAYFYHLKVVNLKPSLPLEGARVLLNAVSKPRPNGEFLRTSLVVPRSFYWSPSEGSQEPQNVLGERVLDFGRLCPEQATFFRPAINVLKFDDTLSAEPGIKTRYHLQIVAENFVSPEQIFEVIWNGKSSDHPNDMAKNVVIEEIKAPELYTY